MIREDIRKGQMHVFFVALLFNHIGFLWRSYYQQNQSKAFKDSKNEKYEISIEILIVKYRKNQCLNIFLLNLFNFFWQTTQNTFCQRHGLEHEFYLGVQISYPQNEMQRKRNMIINLNYILIVLVKKLH